MNKWTALLCLLLFCGIRAQAQRVDIGYLPDTGSVYGNDYRRAMFCGGTDSLRTYLAAWSQYPNEARENQIEGRVVVRFFVDEQGNISGIRSIRGIAPSCDSMAVRIVRAMPRWQPATYKGRPVGSYNVQPINFRLQ
jgi:TonB family protein